MNITKLLKSGKVGVVPSDTLYGISCSALNKKAVQKIYKIKDRDFDKPFIILISSIKQLKLLKINLSKQDLDTLNKIWPDKVSVVLPCPSAKLEYLHRGKKSLAIRYPNYKELTDIIEQTGPIVSTSINKQDLPPATSVKQAKKCFGNKIDFYMDIGELKSEPSTVVTLNNGKLTVLRQGSIKVEIWI